MAGDLFGASTSLQVDMNKVKEEVQAGETFGSNTKTLTTGTDQVPEPIGLRLTPIHEAFSFYFYQNLDQQVLGSCPKSFTETHLEKLKANVKKLLKKYPQLKGANTPVGKMFCFLCHLLRSLYTACGMCEPRNYSWQEMCKEMCKLLATNRTYLNSSQLFR